MRRLAKGRITKSSLRCEKDGAPVCLSLLTLKLVEPHNNGYLLLALQVSRFLQLPVTERSFLIVEG